MSFNPLIDLTKRGIACALAFSLIATSSHVAEAASAVPDLLQGPSNLPQFQLAPPQKLGRIVDYFNVADPASRRTGEPAKRLLVVLVQDLHAHYGVQKNISGLLDYLTSKLATPDRPLAGSPARTSPFALAVEGASGPLDSSLLARFPNPKIKEQAADFLLREGELTGAEYFAVQHGHSNLLVGVEDAEFYESHRDLFRKSFTAREPLVKTLTQLRQDLEALSRRHASPVIRGLEKDMAAFDQGRLGTEAWITKMAAAAEVRGVDLKKEFPAISGFAANAGAAGSLLSDGTNTALRQATAEFLTTTQPYLSKEEQQNLKVLAKSADPTGYFLYVRDLVYKHQLFLAVTAPLARYLEYVHAVQSIGLDRILFEARELHYRLRTLSAVSTQERDLASAEHDIALLERMADLRATENEVRAFAPRLNQFVALASLLVSASRRTGEPAFNKLNELASGRAGDPAASRTIDPQKLRELISSSIDYYTLAMMRNKPMIDNTLALIGLSEPANRSVGKRTHAGSPDRRLADTAVLITGGFHTAPLTQMLRDRGVSYVVITPTVEEVTEADHELYVKRLRGFFLTPEEIVNRAAQNVADGRKRDVLAPRSALQGNTYLKVSAIAAGTIAVLAVLMQFNGEDPKTLTSYVETLPAATQTSVFPALTKTLALLGASTGKLTRKWQGAASRFPSKHIVESVDWFKNQQRSVFYHNGPHSIDAAEAAFAYATQRGRKKDEVLFLRDLGIVHDFDPERTPNTPARVFVTVQRLEEDFRGIRSLTGVEKGPSVLKALGWEERHLQMALAFIQRSEYPLEDNKNPAYEGTSPFARYEALVRKLSPEDQAFVLREAPIFSEYADKASSYWRGVEHGLQAAENFVEELKNTGLADASVQKLKSGAFLGAIGTEANFKRDRQLAESLGHNISFPLRREFLLALGPKRAEQFERMTRVFQTLQDLLDQGIDYRTARQQAIDSVDTPKRPVITVGQAVASIVLGLLYWGTSGLLGGLPPAGTALAMTVDVGNPVAPMLFGLSIVMLMVADQRRQKQRDRFDRIAGEILLKTVDELERSYAEVLDKAVAPNGQSRESVTSTELYRALTRRPRQTLELELQRLHPREANQILTHVLSEGGIFNSMATEINFGFMDETTTLRSILTAQRQRIRQHRGMKPPRPSVGSRLRVRGFWGGTAIRGAMHRAVLGGDPERMLNRLKQWSRTQRGRQLLQDWLSEGIRRTNDGARGKIVKALRDMGMSAIEAEVYAAPVIVAAPLTSSTGREIPWSWKNSSVDALLAQTRLGLRPVIPQSLVDNLDTNPDARAVLYHELYEFRLARWHVPEWIRHAFAMAAMNKRFYPNEPTTARHFLRDHSVRTIRRVWPQVADDAVLLWVKNDINRRLGETVVFGRLMQPIAAVLLTVLGPKVTVALVFGALHPKSREFIFREYEFFGLRGKRGLGAALLSIPLVPMMLPGYVNALLNISYISFGILFLYVVAVVSTRKGMPAYDLFHGRTDIKGAMHDVDDYLFKGDGGEDKRQPDWTGHTPFIRGAFAVEQEFNRLKAEGDPAIRVDDIGRRIGITLAGMQGLSPQERKQLLDIGRALATQYVRAQEETVTLVYTRVGYLVKKVAARPSGYSDDRLLAELQRDLTFTRIAVDAVRRGPPGLLKRGARRFILDITRIEKRNEAANARMRGEHHIKLGVSFHERNGEFDTVETFDSVWHELTHQLTRMPNKEGSDFLFPIKGLIAFLERNGLTHLRFEMRTVSVRDYFTLPDDLEKDPVARLIELENRIVRLGSRQFVEPSQIAVTPMFGFLQITNPEKFKYRTNPLEMIAWIATGYGEGGFTYFAESRDILEQTLFYADGYAYRFDRELGRFRRIPRFGSATDSFLVTTVGSTSRESSNSTITELSLQEAIAYLYQEYPKAGGSITVQARPLTDWSKSMIAETKTRSQVDAGLRANKIHAVYVVGMGVQFINGPGRANAAPTVEQFNQALSDQEFDEAEILLEDLKEHGVVDTFESERLHVSLLQAKFLNHNSTLEFARDAFMLQYQSLWYDSTSPEAFRDGLESLRYHLLIMEEVANQMSDADPRIRKRFEKLLARAANSIEEANRRIAESLRSPKASQDDRVKRLAEPADSNHAIAYGNVAPRAVKKEIRNNLQVGRGRQVWNADGRKVLRKGDKPVPNSDRFESDTFIIEQAKKFLSQEAKDWLDSVGHVIVIDGMSLYAKNSRNYQMGRASGRHRPDGDRHAIYLSSFLWAELRSNYRALAGFLAHEIHHQLHADDAEAEAVAAENRADPEGRLRKVLVRVGPIDETMIRRLASAFANVTAQATKEFASTPASERPELRRRNDAFADIYRRQRARLERNGTREALLLRLYLDDAFQNYFGGVASLLEGQRNPESDADIERTQIRLRRYNLTLGNLPTGAVDIHGHIDLGGANIRIPTPLRQFAEHAHDATVRGQTVTAALEDLITMYPGLRRQLFYRGNTLLKAVKVYKNGEIVTDPASTPFDPVHDVLTFIPSIAGGSGREETQELRREKVQEIVLAWAASNGPLARIADDIQAIPSIATEEEAKAICEKALADFATETEREFADLNGAEQQALSQIRHALRNRLSNALLVFGLDPDSRSDFYEDGLAGLTNYRDLLGKLAAFHQLTIKPGGFVELDESRPVPNTSAGALLASPEEEADAVPRREIPTPLIARLAQKLGFPGDYFMTLGHQPNWPLAWTEITEALGKRGLLPRPARPLLRVLVADDKAEHRANVIRELQKLPVRLAIREVDTGEAALDFTRRMPFGIVITDQDLMSRVNGVRFVLSVRNDEKSAVSRSRLPIIMVSDAGVPEATRADIGLDASFRKNSAFDAEQFRATVLALTQLQPSAPTIDPTRGPSSGSGSQRIIALLMLLGLGSLPMSAAPLGISFDNFIRAAQTPFGRPLTYLIFAFVIVALCFKLADKADERKPTNYGGETVYGDETPRKPLMRKKDLKAVTLAFIIALVVFAIHDTETFLQMLTSITNFFPKLLQISSLSDPDQTGGVLTAMVGAGATLKRPSLRGVNPIQIAFPNRIESRQTLKVHSDREHEQYHRDGNFAGTLRWLGGLGTVPRDGDGWFDFRSWILRRTGQRAGRQEIRMSSHAEGLGGSVMVHEDGLLSLVSNTFQHDHYGRNEFAAYARNQRMARHEITELRLWAKWALANKIVTPQEILSGQLGDKIREWLNPQDKRLQILHAEIAANLLDSFHERATRAETEDAQLVAPIPALVEAFQRGGWTTRSYRKDFSPTARDFVGSSDGADVSGRSADTLEALVRKDIISSVAKLFSEGPNQWVKLPTQPTGEFVFQRGLSGDFNQGSRAALREALRFLKGAADPEPRYVTKLTDLNDSTAYAFTTHSGYSGPLTVRGRSPSMELLNAWTIPAGSNIDWADAIGLFTPSKLFAFNWARNYLSLLEQLQAAGLAIPADSRGALFAAELRDAFSHLRFGEVDPLYNAAPVLNGDEIAEELDQIFERYGRPTSEEIAELNDRLEGYSSSSSKTPDKGQTLGSYGSIAMVGALISWIAWSAGALAAVKVVAVLLLPLSLWAVWNYVLKDRVAKWKADQTREENVLANVTSGAVRETYGVGPTAAADVDESAFLPKGLRNSTAYVTSKRGLWEILRQA